MKRFLCVLVLMMAVATGVRGDEIRLKDGSKIVGTIIDFENDSFKVQTAYGFAMVRKDSIAQIIPSEPKKSEDAAKAASPAALVKPAVASESALAAKAEVQPAVSRPNKPSEGLPTPATAAAQPAALTTKAESATPGVADTALSVRGPEPGHAAPPAAASAPAPPPAAPPAAAPAPIRESVQGTLYNNETYSFRLYRPPGWDLIAARNTMPNAITAIGTTDQTALFIVGREPVRDTLEAQAGNAERLIQKVYDNYRHVSSTKRIVGGLPAVEWRFRGLADGHDWSVMALTIAHGDDVFTLLGMTYGDSDLIQIRENVIAKMIASLQFDPAH